MLNIFHHGSLVALISICLCEVSTRDYLKCYLLWGDKNFIIAVIASCVQMLKITGSLNQGGEEECFYLSGLIFC